MTLDWGFLASLYCLSFPRSCDVLLNSNTELCNVHNDSIARLLSECPNTDHISPPLLTTICSFCFARFVLSRCDTCTPDYLFDQRHHNRSNTNCVAQPSDDLPELESHCICSTNLLDGSGSGGKLSQFIKPKDPNLHPPASATKLFLASVCCSRATTYTRPAHLPRNPSRGFSLTYQRDARSARYGRMLSPCASSEHEVRYNACRRRGP